MFIVEYTNIVEYINMDELIVNTWIELIIKYPDLNPNEIFEMVQKKLNVSYEDIIGAISRVYEKRC